MSVYKRRGSWFCDITIDGRRVQRVIKGARTRSQAIKAATVIENKLFKKKYGLEEKQEVRFDKFVKETFLPYSKLHKKSYADDVYRCGTLCGFFGRFNLSEITPPMIEKFKRERLEGKTSRGTNRNPATVNRELSVLSKIFSLAFDSELIESNPCRRVRNLPTDCNRTRVLTPEEEKSLFAALDGHDWVKNIVTLALNTGMRQGEIFKLTWFDVDFQRNVILVRQTKNNKNRYVPMNETVRRLLSSLPQKSGLVFPSPKTGGQIVDVKTTFNAARTTAKLNDFRFHDLRHTAATRMADSGTDAFTLASIFGWSDIRMALRYTRATDETKRRAVEKLAKKQASRDSKVTKKKRQAGGTVANRQNP